MDSVLVVYVFGAFFLKHFVCDFPLQTAYQYTNKDNYGHPGGILHAVIHAIGTTIVLIAFIPIGTGVILLLSLVDGLVHYHVDWAKMNLNTYCKLTPSTSEYFWHLLGLDQLLHYLTYFGIVLYLIW